MLDLRRYYKCPRIDLFPLAKGPSKNYLTARGEEGVNDFVTYRYVYFEGGGRVFYEIVT